jgi:hypothetical protein
MYVKWMKSFFQYLDRFYTPTQNIAKLEDKGY